MKRLVLLPVVLFALVHCGDRLSTQEANAVCEELADRDPAITGKVFNECVACYENCEECRQINEDATTVFKCPDQLPATDE